MTSPAVGDKLGRTTPRLGQTATAIGFLGRDEGPARVATLTRARPAPFRRDCRSVGRLFAPFFLVIPLMVSSVISSDSFAGEKERKTIEALLAAPFTDGELLMGKVLVSFAPAMGVTLLGFILYTAVVDALTVGRFGFLLLPNLTWLVMILFLALAVSLLGIGATVIISSRVKGFREAQQLSALMVVPVLALLFGQAAGFIIMGPGTLLALTVLVLVADAALFGVGVSVFNRERILSQSH